MRDKFIGFLGLGIEFTFWRKFSLFDQQIVMNLNFVLMHELNLKLDEHTWCIKSADL
jgi:hypothetical protein